jgi:hypothetical protein
MNPNRRHFLAQASALAATFGTAPAILHAQSGTRPLLRAGDQKAAARAARSGRRAERRRLRHRVDRASPPRRSPKR